MNAWELVVAYLVVFVLLQFVIYRYLRSDDDGAPTRWGQIPNAEAGPRRESRIDRESAVEATARSDHLEEDPDVDVDAGRRCMSCGAKNESEPAYEYCRHCAGPLRR